MKKVLLLIAGFAFMFAFTSCKQQGSAGAAEEAQEVMEEAAEEVQEAIEEATEEVQDSVKENMEGAEENNQ